MLSNHLQDRMETAKLLWSRLPNSDEEIEGRVQHKKTDGGSMESLDYEVFEDYAYRPEQVWP